LDEPERSSLLTAAVRHNRGEASTLRKTKITLPERGLEALFGPHDQNIKYLESLLSVRVGGRGGELMVEGEEADVAVIERILKDYSQLFTEGRVPSDTELRAAFKQIAEDRTASLRDLFSAQKRINPSGRKQVTARSQNQRRYIEAIEQDDIVFGIGPAGTGKCIAADSLVLTSAGMIEIGELGAATAPGDHVPLTATIHGADGPASASHIYNGGETDTLRITTRCGFSIEATPEHPLLVFDREAQLQWRRADQLQVDDVLVLQRGQKMFGDRTMIDFTDCPASASDRSARPVQLSELDDEFAYLMGVLTGDGCLSAGNRVILSSADESIVAAFQRLASRFGLPVFRHGSNRPDDYLIVSAQLHQLLIHLGMSSGTAPKRIPRAILTAPEYLVAAFLRGLFDADGTVEKRDGRISLCSVSETLIRQTQLVLLNFGIISAKSVKRGRDDGRKHISHRLTIAGAEAARFDQLIGFGLERKRARLAAGQVNPGIDLIPPPGPMINAAVRSVTFSRDEHNRFYDYRIERRHPGYHNLAEIVSLSESRDAQPELIRPIRGLIDPHLFFAEIVSIEPSHAQVFDLTVPETHSFVANGFINHNTYLAVAMAVQYLLAKRVNRIVLARPAVEAGEKLGFLPGDLQDKVDPYLRPLYDALFDLMDFERVTKFLEKRVIEIAPLAFMRGRAQSLDSLLMTPQGWRRMGEIKVGDLVIGSDGKPIVVTGVFPQGEKQVYRVTMTDGSNTLACAEHLWQVRTLEDKQRNRSPRVLQTQAMLGNFRRNHQYRYELPLLSAPVEWAAREVPIEPYALGLMLGDRCLSGKTSPIFATAETELVSSLSLSFAALNRHIRRKSEIDYVIVDPLAGKGGNKSAPVRNPLTQALRELNLPGTCSPSKFIPEVYLYNSAAVRIALLQGLLDTDGGPVTPDGRSCRIQYSTTSERLKDDVVFLVRSLGGVASWRKRLAEGRTPGLANGRPVPYRSDAYVLAIRLPEQIKPFRLRRKAEIYERFGGACPIRFIKNIEPVGLRETQCISVAAPDSLYVTDDFILTHNTLSDAFIILDEAQNTTSEQMKMFLTRIGFGSKAVITGDVTQIDLPSGRKSGLVEAQRVVQGIEGISFIEFNDTDVVRHRLVQMIIKAYDEHNRKLNI
jgi:phosphate starvation-inducible PhoH-like protein